MIYIANVIDLEIILLDDIIYQVIRRSNTA